MAGFVPFGQNLQLQSGVPLSKVATVFMEKLSVVKRMDGGGMGGLMGKVIQDGNLSAIMQNPAAALTNAVQSQVGGLVSQIQGMVGGGPQGLIDAIQGATGAAGLTGGLDQAMGALRAAGDNLAGLTNGAQGFFAMIGHANTADLAGAALPAAAAMSTVTAPLTAAPFVRDVAARLPGVVADVVAGQMPADAATAWVLDQVHTAATIVAGSAGALAWSEQMHPMIATVSSVAGALAVPPVFDEAGNRHEGEATGFQGVLRTLVQPEPQAAMDAALAAQIAHTPPERVDVAAMTSLEG